MKLMYKVIGKRMIKEFLKIQLMILVFAGLFMYSLKFSLMESIIFLSLPIVAFTFSYFVFYFGEYRALFKEIRIEVALEDKYQSLLTKFNKTY